MIFIVNDNIYLRDLQARQNQPITQAQLYLYNNTKRYSSGDLEESIEIMIKGKQVDLDGKSSADNSILDDRKNRRIDKEEENKEIVYCYKEFVDDKFIKKCEEEVKEKILSNCFVYKTRLVVLDNKGNNLTLRYKEDLFIELIEEFTKLSNWLDSRASFLRFNDSDGNNLIISKDEVDSSIELFNKLNRIKNDDNK